MILILAQDYRKAQKHARAEGLDPHQWRFLSRVDVVKSYRDPIIHVLPQWQLGKSFKLIQELEEILKDQQAELVVNF